MKTLLKIILFCFKLLILVTSHKSTQIPQTVYIRKSPARTLLSETPTYENSQQPQIQQGSLCPCMKETQACPPCNPYEFTKAPINCPCAPKATCPPCILAKTQKFLHEQAEKEAKAQAQTEESLSREAQLQSKLFSLAMKFAKEASEQEELARKAALALQQASSRAQIARNKMKRATNQARLLAIKAISTISTNQLDKTLNEMAGKVQAERNNYMKTPQSLEEAITSNDLETSMEIANDINNNLNVNLESELKEAGTTGNTEENNAVSSSEQK